jgi:hypothetical protein
MKQEKISIDEDTHRMLKAYCLEQGYKMGAFVSRLIREKIGDVGSKDSSRDTDKP